MALSFEDKQDILWVLLPMKYDGDASDVEHYLKPFGTVTEKNIISAIKYVTQRFEQDRQREIEGREILRQMEDDW